MRTVARSDCRCSFSTATHPPASRDTGTARRRSRACSRPPSPRPRPFRGRDGVGGDDQIRHERAIAQPRTGPRRIAPAAIVERPLPVVERGVGPARFRVPQHQQPFHTAMLRRLCDGKPCRTGTFSALFDRWAWRPIPNCPGRYALRAGRTHAAREHCSGPDALAATCLGRSQGSGDLVTPFEDGGLISYRKADGMFLHTLNTREGFERKLRQLGILCNRSKHDRPSRIACLLLRVRHPMHLESRLIHQRDDAALV